MIGAPIPTVAQMREVSWDAWRGLLLRNDYKHLCAAIRLGLLGPLEWHDDGADIPDPTDKGNAHLAGLRKLAESMSDGAADHLAWVARETPVVHDPATTPMETYFTGMIEVVTEMTAPDGGPRWHLRIEPLGRAVLHVRNPSGVTHG